MTEARFDTAKPIGIENALELLEERLERAKANFTTIMGAGYIDGLIDAIEIVKLNMPPKK